MTTGETRRKSQGDIAAEIAAEAAEALRNDNSTPISVTEFRPLTDESVLSADKLPIGRYRFEEGVDTDPANVTAGHPLDDLVTEGAAVDSPVRPHTDRSPTSHHVSRIVLTRFRLDDIERESPYFHNHFMVSNLTHIANERTAASLAMLSFYGTQSVGVLAARIGYNSGMVKASDHARNFIKHINDRLANFGLVDMSYGDSLFDTPIELTAKGKRLALLASALIGWSAAEPNGQLGLVFGGNNDQSVVDMSERLDYIRTAAKFGLEPHTTPKEGTKARFTRDGLLRVGLIFTKGRGLSGVKDDASMRSISELADIIDGFAVGSEKLEEHVARLQEAMFRAPDSKPSRTRISLHDTVAKVASK